MTNEELKTILENHEHWLREDCEGWADMRADLYRANLRGANLRGANLRGADLSAANLRGANLRGADLYRADLSAANLRGANLSGADLSRANLRGADLFRADLSGANLRGANLRGANLRGADLSRANLRGADLYRADLSAANLRGANLRGADLSRANLRGADLYRADLSGAINIPYIPMVCPEEGSFTGWKKASNRIIKLTIPENAKRTSATTHKCRCDKAIVEAIYNYDGTVAEETRVSSDHDIYFIYEIGKEVKVTDFCEDRWEECAKGIHFFINRQEAINYV